MSEVPYHELPLELCRGITKYMYGKVSQFAKTKVVDKRGEDHPIFSHELRAEKADSNVFCNKARNISPKDLLWVSN